MKQTVSSALRWGRTTISRSRLPRASCSHESARFCAGPRCCPATLRHRKNARLFRFGEWKLDTTGRFLVDSNETVVSLSGAEYRLLRVFLDHPQHVLNRDQLLDLTQGRETEVYDRSIDLLVSRLRQRLRDDAREPSYIKTVRSEGYVFAVSVEALPERS
jgi:two-component system, OmpR family, response regulator